MKLFFNYRREDTADLAGRLHDRLSSEFGTENIFKDVDSIRPGQDWRVALEKSVVSSDVVIAIIGRNWLTVCDAKGQRRIESDEDYVRFELEAARKAGKVVVPLLVQEAKVPAPGNLPESIRWLSNTHAAELRPDPHFKDDVNRLVAELARIRDQIKITAQQNNSFGADAVSSVRCGKCNSQCSRSDQFCQSCGAGLWTSCPSCKASVPVYQVHCGTCGAHLTKLREMMELTERIEKRFSVVAGMLDVSDRLSGIDHFSRELEAALRVYPQQQRLMEIQVQLKELWRSSARQLADGVFHSGKLEQARDLYLELKKLDPLSGHAAARLDEIDSRLLNDLSKSRERMAKGDYKGAIDELNALANAFPGNQEVRSELLRCQTIATRLSQLIPEGLRELKRQRSFFRLEQELLWLKEQRIPVRNLESWLTEVKDAIRKANADFQQAQSELRSGRIRNAQKLADAILKEVSDHQGARELLETTGDTEAAILQIQLLVKKQHFCAANRLIRKLEDDRVSDPRLTRLAAATRVEIATMDSSLRMMLILFFLACLPGYFLKGLIISKLPFLSEGESEPGIWWSAAIVFALPVLQTSVIFLATPLRIERCIRFLMDWLQLRRVTDRLGSMASRSEKPAREKSDESTATTAAVPDVQPTQASRESSNSQRTARSFESVVPDAPFTKAPPDVSEDVVKRNPVLYRTMDIDRSAQLFELIVFLGPLFCFSVVLGAAFWNWLLGMKFDPESVADLRSIEILSPFSSVVPVLLLWAGGFLMSPEKKWTKVLITGIAGGTVEFLGAVLYPASVIWIRSIVVVTLMLVTVQITFQEPFSKVLTRFFAGVGGAIAVLSAVGVPLAIGMSVVNYSEHTLSESLMMELSTTSLILCQVFVVSVNPAHLWLPAFARESTQIRGALAIGAGWISAAVLTLATGWLTSILQEEWQNSGRWFVLLLLMQFLPEMLTGRYGFTLHRQWLIMSSVLTLIMCSIWWLSPESAALLAPVLFCLTVSGLLLLDHLDIFEARNALKDQLRLRFQRRLYELKVKVRR